MTGITAIMAGMASAAVVDDLSDLFAGGEDGDWWRFDVANTTATAVGDPFLTATGIINALALTAPSGSNRPEIGNATGYEYASFLGATADRLIHTFGSDISQPGTIIACMSDGDTSTHAIYTGSSSTKRWQLSNSSGGDLIMFAGSTLDTTLNEPPASTAVVFTAEFNGGSSVFRRNGTQLVTGSAGTQVTNQLTVGAVWDGSSAGSITVYSLLFIDRLLTTGDGGERDRAERLLGSHAGVTW
jgi:hypothetical protein